MQRPCVSRQGQDLTRANLLELHTAARERPRLNEECVSEMGVYRVEIVPVRDYHPVAVIPQAQVRGWDDIGRAILHFDDESRSSGDNRLHLRYDEANAAVITSASARAALPVSDASARVNVHPTRGVSKVRLTCKCWCQEPPASSRCSTVCSRQRSP